MKKNLIKKIGKILYNIFFGFILLIALLLIFSIFPITGNYKVLVVKSGSMEPTIHTGSILVTKPSENYQIGDIITFQGADTNSVSVTHRIQDIRLQEGKTVYITQGDANNAPDQREVLSRYILGKYLFSVPFVGYAVDAARQPIGFIIIIGIPAAIIIYDEIIKIKKEIVKFKKRKEQKDDGQDQEIDNLEEEVDQLKKELSDFKKSKK